MPAEACTTCGVLDALGRHDPMCQYAINIGAPRLAEDEEPIDPAEEEDVVELEREFTESEEPVEDKAWSEQPEAMLRAVATEHVLGQAPVQGHRPTLWFSYRADADVGGFDAIVFESELEALRHAVNHGERVRPLELGRSLTEQANDA